VQGAIDAAEAEGGGEVVVDGVYTENVVIDESNVSLRGRNLGKDKIKGTGADTPVVHVKGTNADKPQQITIRDLWIEGDKSTTPQGIKAQYSNLARFAITRVLVTGAIKEQIQLDNCWSSSVTNSYVGGNDVGTHGIKAINANRVSVRGVKCHNLQGIGSIGFEATDVDGFYLLDCNAESDLEYGVKFTDARARGAGRVDGLYTEKLVGDSRAIWIGDDASKRVEGVEVHNCSLACDQAVYVDEADNVWVSGIETGSSPPSIEATANAGSELFLTQVKAEITVNGDWRTVDAPSRWIPAQAFSVTSGQPELVRYGTAPNQYQAWAFDPDATEEIGTTWQMPRDWGAGDVRATLYWTSPSTAGDDVVLSSNLSAVGEGEDLRASDLYSKITTDSTTAHGVVKRPGNDLTVSPRDLLQLIARRTGGNANDTLSDDALVVGAMLRRVPV
jgi:hypothetical protein